MSEEKKEVKKIERARIVLNKPKTYRYRGEQWIKGVPRVKEGWDEVRPYTTNSHFTVKEMALAQKKKAPVVTTSEDDSKNAGSKVSLGK